MLSKSLLNKRLPIILSLFGFTLFLVGGFYFFFKSTDVKTEISKEVTEEKIDVNDLHDKPFPKRLIIAGVKIDLPVVENKIVDGVWETTQDGVSHLDISANPGEGGNIVFYGHNKKRLLGSLPFVSMGATISVISEDGVEHKYKVFEKKEVEITDVSIAYATESEVLTIYTCDETNTKRIVLFARPV